MPTDNPIITIDGYAVVRFVSARSGKRRAYVGGMDRDSDDRYIATSAIVAVDDDVVTTSSGNKYRLGTPRWPGIDAPVVMDFELTAAREEK